ncbi:MAG: hypothetical protein KC656_07370, partial [Myxococcales bacterium]|nr:hypothetical protein [Myxococcales bacterium]
MSRALVVHATDLLARGWAATSPDRTGPDGEPVNALYSTVLALRRALAMKTPDLALAVMDPRPDPTWPEALAAQQPRLREVLEAHGLAVLEAEDATRTCAALARGAVEAGHDVVVAGSDKRLAQLVGKGVWFYDAYKDVRYTPDRVHKRFGVGPASVGDWLALVGDEGIPGIKGVGAKGAVGLIEAHDDAEGIMAAVETVEGRTGNALRKAGVDALRASFTLCRLDDPPLSGLVPYTPPDPEALNALYLDLGFAGLLKPTEAPSGYRTASTAEEVRALVASLGDAPVSVYALTEDPSPVRGDLLGLALSAAPDTATWVPREALDGLSGWLADPACPKLGHDVKAATVALARRGSTLAGVVGDTALASHLVSPSGMAPHELDPLCRVRLHRALQDPDAVLGRGNGRKRWAQVPAGKRAAFACQRAEAALALWSTFVPTDAVRMAEDLDLCETLVRMELRGMPVSAGELDTVGEDFE